MSQVERTALIVDDEESIRYVLSRQLEKLGYKCVAVSSGGEALRTINRQEFALVMLDVRMPGISGLEVLKALRLNYPETCVVMLTAVVDTLVAAKAMKSGADDYITKPCSLEYLSARLRRGYERRELARQREKESLASDGEPQKGVDLLAITNDLVHQQVAAYERATLCPTTNE